MVVMMVLLTVSMGVPILLVVCLWFGLANHNESIVMQFFDFIFSKLPQLFTLLLIFVTVIIVLVISSSSIFLLVLRFVFSSIVTSSVVPSFIVPSSSVSSSSVTRISVSFLPFTLLPSVFFVFCWLLSLLSFFLFLV